MIQQNPPIVSKIEFLARSWSALIDSIESIKTGCDSPGKQWDADSLRDLNRGFDQAITSLDWIKRRLDLFLLADSFRIDNGISPVFVKRSDDLMGKDGWVVYSNHFVWSPLRSKWKSLGDLDGPDLSDAIMDFDTAIETALVVSKSEVRHERHSSENAEPHSGMKDSVLFRTRIPGMAKRLGCDASATDLTLLEAASNEIQRLDQVIVDLRKIWKQK